MAITDAARAYGVVAGGRGRGMSSSRVFLNRGNRASITRGPAAYGPMPLRGRSGARRGRR
jgi:hypothetical protein